ncbi:hypothetical protein GCM10011313_21560 [Mycetocola zhadangensis]|nr:hypothetical protein GCM10011313_21560 [Mycetocola zhadangensis]
MLDEGSEDASVEGGDDGCAVDGDSCGGHGVDSSLYNVVNTRLIVKEEVGSVKGEANNVDLARLFASELSVGG